MNITDFQNNKLKKFSFIAIINVLLLVVLLGLAELAIILLLNAPPPFIPVLRVLSSYYTDYDRRIIQALPDCAIYDPELTYRLRPGACQFMNYDFDNLIEVNSLGTRDDEDSLEAPEIVVLGDSFAMGWGVEGSETFAELIEMTCGMRTLNAGISSYGTVREMKLLERVDQSNLKAVIIQYSDNDFDENRLYFERGNTLTVMSESEYASMQRTHMEYLEYYPGKHILQFIPFVADRMSQRIRLYSGPAEEANLEKQIDGVTLASKYFLNALENVTTIEHDVRIIAFRLNGRDKNNDRFAQALSAALSSEDHSEISRSIEVIDFSEKLTRGKFLGLDDHISASGHRVVADELVEALGC